MDSETLLDSDEERKAMLYACFTGKMPGVCPFCRRVFADVYVARRHVKTSKKCMAERESGLNGRGARAQSPAISKSTADERGIAHPRLSG